MTEGELFPSLIPYLSIFRSILKTCRSMIDTLRITTYPLQNGEGLRRGAGFHYVLGRLCAGC